MLHEAAFDAVPRFVTVAANEGDAERTKNSAEVQRLVEKRFFGFMVDI